MKSAFYEKGTQIQVNSLQRREWESNKSDRAQSQFQYRLHRGKRVDFSLSNIFLQTVRVSWVCHLQMFSFFSSGIFSYPRRTCQQTMLPQILFSGSIPPTPVGMDHGSYWGWWQGEIWETRSCYMRPRVKKAGTQSSITVQAFSMLRAPVLSMQVSVTRRIRCASKLTQQPPLHCACPRMKIIIQSVYF